MSFRRRLLMSWTALALGMALGCMSGTSDPTTLPVSRDTPFALNVPGIETSSATARSQKPDTRQAPPTPPPTQTKSGISPPIQQASTAPPSAASSAVRVRAWVNGKPVFDDEVVYAFGPQIRSIYQNAPPATRDEELQKAYNKALDALIDSELLMQDALNMLKNSPKNLESIKATAAKEADKQIWNLLRANKVDTLDEFKQLILSQGVTLEGLRRVFEREYIANGWLREKVRTAIDHVGLKELREYYDQHSNEFMQVDRVKWQNIFIAIGPKNPTKAQARQKAEEVLQRWATGEDISRLLVFDDGLAGANQGTGVGEIKGDIRPRELEPFLFAMKDGEFGPLVELSTGIHLFRVLKREHAGVMPFDVKMQENIRNKLVNEIVERERRVIVRQLRDKASIDISRDQEK